MLPYRACFHFIDLFRYKALTIKAEKTCKTLFKGSSYKMPKVKKLFLVNIYFIYHHSKIKKNRVAQLFFQIRSI